MGYKTSNSKVIFWNTQIVQQSAEGCQVICAGIGTVLVGSSVCLTLQREMSLRNQGSMQDEQQATRKRMKQRVFPAL